MDALAAESGELNSITGKMPVSKLQHASMQFDKLSQLANGRAELLNAVAARLQWVSGAGAVIGIAISPNAGAASTDSTEICILATQTAPVPDNVEQWATSVGLKSILSGTAVLETVEDGNCNPVKMIAVPLAESNQYRESIAALFVSGSNDGFVETALIQSAVHAIERWDANFENERLQQLAGDVAALNEIVSKIEDSESPKTCCSQIANQLFDYIVSQQNGDGHEQSAAIDVYMALADTNQNTKLTAISNRDSLPDDTATIECIEAAVGECLCRNRETNWPASENDRHALLCHERLSRHLARPNLLTVPLHDSVGKLQGVVLVASEIALSLRTRRFCTSCALPLGSTMSLIGRAQQNQLQKFINNLRESLRTQKALLAFKCTAALLILGLIPLPYKVATDCEVQPVTRRFVSSPFNAQLQKCLVEPGDIVAAGEIIAQLDEREIKMELEEIEADFHRASKKRDGFVAAHDSGEAKLAQLEAEKLRARNDLLSHRNNNLELRSPIAGIVISGDHKKAEGMPLETGQSLFEIAPLDQLFIELLVPDSDIRYVADGMSVRIGLDAFPFECWKGVVERVHPASEIRNDENVFVATVLIENADGKMRPGMRGTAKISTVWRPIVWNWLHKPVSKCCRWLGW